MFWFGVFLILGLIAIVLFPIIWLVAGIAMVGFLFYLICRVIVELVAGNRWEEWYDARHSSSYCSYISYDSYKFILYEI